jgi:hypothetical protein
MPEPARRFPPSWRADQIAGGFDGCGVEARHRFGHRRHVGRQRAHTLARAREGRGDGLGIHREGAAEPRAAARRRIHSTWALSVFAASDIVCSRRILGGILRAGRWREPPAAPLFMRLSLTRAG